MNLSEAIVGPLPEMQIEVILRLESADFLKRSSASFNASSQQAGAALFSKRILANEKTSPSGFIKAPFSEEVPMSTQKTASFTLFGFYKLIDDVTVVKKVAQRLVVVNS